MMDTFPAYEPAGLLIDQKLITAVRLHTTLLPNDENEDDDFDYDVERLQKALHIDFICFPDFTGELTPLITKETDTVPDTLSYDCDIIYILPAQRSPDLFHAAYRDGSELIDEFYETFKKELPREIIRDAIYTVNGTYYC